MHDCVYKISVLNCINFYPHWAHTQISHLILFTVIDHALLETSHQVRPVLGSRILSGLIVLTNWKDLTVNVDGNRDASLSTTHRATYDQGNVSM